MKVSNRLFACLSALLLGSMTLLAQAEGESPYSSSTVDAPPGGNFFNTYGVAIICGIVFVGLLAFVLLRGRTRS